MKDEFSIAFNLPYSIIQNPTEKQLIKLMCAILFKGADEVLLNYIDANFSELIGLVYNMAVNVYKEEDGQEFYNRVRKIFTSRK